MGLKRLPHRPFCGPLLSKLRASEKTFPFADQPRRVDDVLRRNVVQRAGFVVRAPAPPILQAFRSSLDILERHFFIRLGHGLSILTDRVKLIQQTDTLPRHKIPDFRVDDTRCRENMHSFFGAAPLLELRFTIIRWERMEREIMDSNAVGMIGLGIMGSAMSRNLMKAGFKVVGYDVVPARRREHRKAGGTVARSAGSRPSAATSW